MTDTTLNEKPAPTAACRKCGGHNISTRFALDPRDLGQGRQEEQDRRRRLKLPETGEMMQKQCISCTYVWAERPLDWVEDEPREA